MDDAPDRTPQPRRKLSAAHGKRRALAELLGLHGIELLDVHYTRLQLLALLSVVAKDAAAHRDGDTPRLAVRRGQAQLRRLGLAAADSTHVRG